MDRIKRLSLEVLDNHKSRFGEDFADNKKILDQISIIRSKGLKNEVAGYITKFVKKEIREEKAKQARNDSSKNNIEISDEIPSEDVESITMTADDIPDEIVVAETPAAETPAAETPAAETPAAETPAAETHLQQKHLQQKHLQKRTLRINKILISYFCNYC